METVLIIAGAYLLGTVPTALLIARFGSDVDIRTVGSENVGAANTFKKVGTQARILVLLTDVAKGMLVMAMILGSNFPQSSQPPPQLPSQLATTSTYSCALGVGKALRWSLDSHSLCSQY